VDMAQLNQPLQSVLLLPGRLEGQGAVHWAL
jgi:hypothetical protein